VLIIVHLFELLALDCALAFSVYGLRLFLLQSRIVFRPSRDIVQSPEDCNLPFEQVVLPLSGGKQARGWWIPARQASKAILYLPGGIGNMSRELSTLQWLSNLGVHVMAIDYPGYGQSSGRPSESGCYAAADAAWRYAVGHKGIAPQDVVIFGRSLGAAIAAHAAAQNECGALVIHSGVSSVPAVAARRYPFLPVYLFCYIRFNTLKHLRRSNCPTLVLHSTGDRVIPFRHGEEIFRAAPSPKRFLKIPGDHYTNEWHSAPGLASELSSLLFSKAEVER
jgi:pimeloyl-ACP methyl ester carboxylesterase